MEPDETPEADELAIVEPVEDSSGEAAALADETTAVDQEDVAVVEPEGQTGPRGPGPDPIGATGAPGPTGPADLAPPIGCTLPDAPLIPSTVSTGCAALQRVLKRRGWYSGPVNGHYDEATVRAVQKLQQTCKRVELDPGPVNGVYSVQTRTAACWLLSR